VPPLGRGRIVLAEVPDPNGQNPKARPLVIVTATEEIQEGKPFVGVAVSTTIPHPVPDDCVELPYHHAGHPRTGLRKRCVAVCTWRHALTHEDVIRDLGRVPDQQMFEILEKVQRYTAPGTPD
jgi:mRNA-degrading endonuclease toxin of MazEF toxin-antitoxin module